MNVRYFLSAALAAILCTFITGESWADPPSTTFVFSNLVQVDRNRDGRLNVDEYIDMNRGILRNDFNRLDKNNDGFITREELLGTKAASQVRRRNQTASSERWHDRRSVREGRVGSDSD